MRLGLRTATRAATALLLAGSAVLAAPAIAQSHGGFHGGGGGFHSGGGGGFHGGVSGGFHGGGYGGYHGGYGGYRGGYGGFRGGYYGGFGYGYGCCGYYGGFGFGDALLGAALIGGTAAVIASDQPAYYETYPAPVYPAYAPAAPPPEAYGYAPPPPPPAAPPAQQQAYRPTDPVEQCTRAAVDEAASRGDSGHVTRIDHVDGHPNGARVTGTIEVRRTSHNGEVESAHFTCTADYGQVTFFKFG